MTYTDVPPSGHQFGLHVAAPAQPRMHARSSGVVARWSEIDSGASQPTTVTTESSRAKPRSTCSGSHGLPASSSAMQKPSLPGWPRVERSSRPGAPPPVSVTTSRSARPIDRFARQPGPRTPIPLWTPIASATGPPTTTSWPAGWVVTACPLRLKAGSSAASTAARTTGKYSGRQPARTAHAATRSSVASPMPGGTSPSDWRGSRPPSIASTRERVGGTTGSPSVHPRSNMSSISSAAPALSTSASISSSYVDLAAQPGFVRGASSVISGAGAPTAPQAWPTSADSPPASHPTTVAATEASRSSRNVVGRLSSAYAREVSYGAGSASTVPWNRASRATRAATSSGSSNTTARATPASRSGATIEASRRSASAHVGHSSAAKIRSAGPPATRSSSPTDPPVVLGSSNDGARVRGAGAATVGTPYRRSRAAASRGNAQRSSLALDPAPSAGAVV